MRAPGSLSLLAFVLALPLSALSVGPEIPLAPHRIEPAPFVSERPRVASNGTDFLVVWATGNRFLPTVLRAARVDRNGAVLDASLLISTGAWGGHAVASDGRDYVVASNCQPYPTVCLASVDAATGTVIQGDRLPGAVNAAIASNGNGYVIAYQASNPRGGFPNVVEAVAVRPDATIGGIPFRVADAPLAPAIASNGDAYFVVYNVYSRLEGVLISEEKIIGKHQRITGGAPSWGPAAFGYSIASDGEDFLVAWQQNTGVVEQSYTTDLRTVGISATGEVGARHTIAEQHAWNPAVTWIGSQYLVSYAHSTGRAISPALTSAAADVRALLVSESGPSAPPIALSAAPERESSSSAAFNGAAVLVVWEHEYRPGMVQVEGRFVRNGQVAGDSPPIVISRALPWQESVAGASIGNRTVFAWDENRGVDQKRKVFVQRVDDRGLPLDGEGLAVGESTRDQVRPTLGGSAVVWIEEDLGGFNSTASVWIRFFNSAGDLQQAMLVGQAASQSRAAVAAAGMLHLVVWQSPDGALVGMRIAAVSGPLDAEPFLISDDAELNVNPTVASNGHDFFVAWNASRYGEGCGICIPFSALMAASVHRSGAITRPAFEVMPEDTSAPRLVWNGRAYALFWSGAPTEMDLPGGAFVQTFTPDGDSVDMPRRFAANGTPSSVAWNGSDYLVAMSNGYEPNQVLRLSRDLQVIETLTIHSGNVRDTDAAVVARGDGSAVLAFQSHRNDDYGTSRIIARRIADDADVPRRRAVR